MLFKIPTYINTKYPITNKIQRNKLIGSKSVKIPLKSIPLKITNIY